MMAIWAILRGSLPLQFVVLAVLGWGAFKANNYVQRSIGASSAAAVTSAETLESATETITIIREAEEATPLVVEDTAIKALCCRRASCGNRAKLIAEGQCR